MKTPDGTVNQHLLEAAKKQMPQRFAHTVQHFGGKSDSLAFSRKLCISMIFTTQEDKDLYYKAIQLAGEKSTRQALLKVIRFFVEHISEKSKAAAA